MENKFDIEQFLDLSNYSEKREFRRRRKHKEDNLEGKSATSEFFTPYSIVKKMADKISPEDWADPNKTFLEPSQGNGQFTLFILYRRIHEYNIPWQKALETMSTVELMEDNVQESRQRVHELLRNIAPDYSPSEADEIMDKNFVCSDFFKWDFENWCELKEKPKKKKIKKAS